MHFQYHCWFQHSEYLTVEEILSIDVKTHKILTSAGNFYRKCNIKRSYLRKDERGSGLRQCKQPLNVIQSLSEKHFQTTAAKINKYGGEMKSSYVD